MITEKQVRIEVENLKFDHLAQLQRIKSVEIKRTISRKFIEMKGGQK